MGRNLAVVGSAIIFPVIVVGLFMYQGGFIPQTEGGAAVVRITVTSTATQTAYLTTVSTFTQISTFSTTSVAYQIVTQTLPPTVTVSGHVTTNGPGTTPTGLTFVGQSHGTKTATVSQGQFTVEIPNNDNYAVSIQYSTSPAGTGSCPVGEFLLDTVVLTYSASFQC